MFNFSDFLRKGFVDAVGKLADYQIILNASGYYEKGVLKTEDLERISAAIDRKNGVTQEETLEAPIAEAVDQ